MQKWPVYLLGLLTLLSGCASAPIVCPDLPEPPVKVPLGPSFQDRMEDFLRGKLPEPTSSEPLSPSATDGSTKPASSRAPVRD